MSLLLMYTASNKEKESDEYIYKSHDDKMTITVQSCILMVITFFILFFTNFNYLFVIPFALSIYNLFYVYISIKKVDELVEKKSPKAQINYYSNLFFFLLKILLDEMEKNNTDTDDLKKWKKYYLNQLKSELSLKNFKETTEKLQEHINNLFGKEIEINNKDFKKFVKKDKDKMEEVLFPELKSLISNNKINIKAKQNNTINKSHYEQVATNLKILGLSANTRSFKIITERYYSLVKIYHPDHSSDTNASQKLAELNKAYNELRNFYKSNGQKIS